MRSVSEGCPMETVAFRALVLGYYAGHARDLPWRHTQDPYRILVSEVMLQQTQVSRVLDKYPLFLSAFPDVRTLAGAPLRELLSLWQGLGYNRRAVALLKAAQAIVGEHDGEVPCSLAALQGLPGVGPATAGAISAFAFGLPVAFVETNIRAVFLYHYFSDRATVPDSEILPVVEATLDRTDPRRWFYALMDYGVMLKASRPNPNRRSRHYARQSPFVGSRRELRARALRVVLSTGAASLGGVTASIPGANVSLLAEVLDELTSEGFLKLSEDRYSIA